MLKYDQPRGRKVADHPPKEPQIQSAPEGGRKAMTMILMMTMVILMMTMVIAMCFLHPKGPLTGSAPGGQKTMMMNMIMMIRMMMMNTKMMMMIYGFNV